MILQRSSLPGSEVDDEMVFFNPNKGSYYGTGPVGAEIWRYLETPRSFSDICSHLVSQFDIDRPTCEAQVKAFVNDMLSEGIVEQV